MKTFFKIITLVLAITFIVPAPKAIAENHALRSELAVSYQTLSTSKKAVKDKKKFKKEVKRVKHHVKYKKNGKQRGIIGAILGFILVIIILVFVLIFAVLGIVF